MANHLAVYISGILKINFRLALLVGGWMGDEWVVEWELVVKAAIKILIRAAMSSKSIN